MPQSLLLTFTQVAFCACRCAPVSPQPFGTEPIFLISEWLVARRFAIFVVSRSWN